MSSEYSPLMTPLSFSKASMLMCSFLELRKSSISLITSASLMLIVSSAVMITDPWWQLTAGWNIQQGKGEVDEAGQVSFLLKPVCIHYLGAMLSTFIDHLMLQS